MDVVSAAGISIKTTNCYGVLLGTGCKVRTEGICAQVELNLGALRVVTDFLPLKFGRADVILGIKLLETLGNMQVNWRTMIMRFKMAGPWVTLQGDPSLCKSPITLKAMICSVERKAQGFQRLLALFCKNSSSFLTCHRAYLLAKQGSMSLLSRRVHNLFRCDHIAMPKCKKMRLIAGFRDVTSLYHSPKY